MPMPSPPPRPAQPPRPPQAAEQAPPGPKALPPEPARPRPGRLRRAWMLLDIPWLGGIRVAPWFLLTAVLILVGAAVGARYIQGHPDRLYYWTVSFSIAPDETQFTFDLEKSPSAVAECTVRARSADNLVVGRRTDIVVGPTSDGQRFTTTTVVIPTTARPVVAEVEDCRITRSG